MDKLEYAVLCIGGLSMTPRRRETAPNNLAYAVYRMIISGAVTESWRFSSFWGKPLVGP